MNCQTDIDDCGSNPCQNGGTCEDKVNMIQLYGWIHWNELSNRHR